AHAGHAASAAVHRGAAPGPAANQTESGSMKIDLSAPLHGFNGEPIPETSAPDSPPATLRHVLTQACLAANPQQYATGADKYRVYRLLKRVDEGGKHEFTAEEVAELKKLVGNVYPVAIVG